MSSQFRHIVGNFICASAARVTVLCFCVTCKSRPKLRYHFCGVCFVCLSYFQVLACWDGQICGPRNSCVQNKYGRGGETGTYFALLFLKKILWKLFVFSALYRDDESEAFYAGIVAEAPNGRNDLRWVGTVKLWKNFVTKFIFDKQ